MVTAPKTASSSSSPVPPSSSAGGAGVGPGAVANGGPGNGVVVGGNPVGDTEKRYRVSVSFDRYVDFVGGRINGNHTKETKKVFWSYALSYAITVMLTGARSHR